MNATRIQILNGQQIETASNLLVSKQTHRAWNLNDMDEFPQAEKQLAADELLIVDRRDGSVWAISANDAAAVDIGRVIEINEGQFIRESAF